MRHWGPDGRRYCSQIELAHSTVLKVYAKEERSQFQKVLMIDYYAVQHYVKSNSADVSAFFHLKTETDPGPET
jgi:hypothetical protein